MFYSHSNFIFLSFPFLTHRNLIFCYIFIQTLSFSVFLSSNPYLFRFPFQTLSLLLSFHLNINFFAIFSSSQPYLLLSFHPKPYLQFSLHPNLIFSFPLIQTLFLLSFHPPNLIFCFPFPQTLSSLFFFHAKPTFLFLFYSLKPYLFCFPFQTLSLVFSPPPNLYLFRFLLLLFLVLNTFPNSPGGVPCYWISSLMLLLSNP